MEKILTLFSLIVICSITSIAQSFENVSTELGINHWHSNYTYIGGGVAWFDIDNDGWDDLYITGGLNQDKIYRNLQGTQFIELENSGLGITAGKYTNGIAIGDINNDGYDDIYITSGNWNDPDVSILLLNNKDNTFEDISVTSCISKDSTYAISATMGDYNLDGYLDIYVAGYVESGPGGVYVENSISFINVGHSNKLYINNRNNSFSELSLKYGVGDIGNTLAVASTDFDSDHDIDIMVANDFGQWNQPNTIYINTMEEELSFDVIDSTKGANLRIFAMGIANGDYDEDGDIDYYITNIGRNVLLRNDGVDGFADDTRFAQVEDTYSENGFASGWGTAFLDIDNDSYLDLYVSNGEIPTENSIEADLSNPNKLFLNNGVNYAFNDLSILSQTNDDSRGRGVAYSDFDNDGDLDLAVAIITDEHNTSNTILYKNEQNTNNSWVKFLTKGVDSNSNGFGAKIMLEMEDGRSFLREVDGGSSFCSRHSNWVHFGLGRNNEIINVRVIWPGGKEVSYGPLSINQAHVLQESMITSTKSNEVDISFDISPNPVNEFINIHTDQTFLHYQLFDITGKLLQEGNFSNQIKLNQSNQNGMFVLKCIANDYIVSNKIMVQASSFK